MDLLYINKFYQNSDNRVLPQGQKVPLLASLATFLVIMSQYKYLMWYMFYYNDRPRTPSFPSELVKTESHVIIRSVETYLLGR